MQTEIETPGRLGQLIREARIAAGMSQMDLATKIGTGRRFIVDMESGKASAHLGKVLDACRALGLKISIGEDE